MIAQALTFSS